MLGSLAALCGVGWWIHAHQMAPTRPPVAQPGAGATPELSVAPRPSPDPAGTAQLSIAVSDDAGPVRDAVVRLVPQAGEIVVVKTGADGLARAEQLVPGRWQISASAEGHLPAALSPQEIAVGSAGQVALRLSSGGRTLHGMVSDTAGGPVAGARIEAAKLLSTAVPDDSVSTTVTAADGTYRVTVPEGTLLVAVTSADYAPQIRRITVGPAGAVANFSLIPGSAIEGVVKDERTDEPVAGASVRALRTPGVMYAAERRVTAGSDGRFRITGLKPGDWQLEAGAPPRHTRERTHVALAVAEQVAAVELRVAVTPVIRGRVIDERGAPAPGVELRAIGYRDNGAATADGNGSFEMQGLPPGNYTLSGESKRYLRAKGTNVWLGDKDVDGVVVVVQRGLVVKGHVEPRQPCDVQYEFEAGSRRSPAVPDVATSMDGAFTLGPFDAGAAKLVARCASGDQGDLSLQVAEAMPEATIVLKPGASLSGRVLDPEGRPVPGVSVIANSPEALAALDSNPRGVPFRNRGGMITSGEQALTDASGAFEITGLPSGSYGFQVLDRSRPLRPHRPFPVVALTAGERRANAELAVELATGVIAGVVTAPDGAPLVDAWVSAYPQASVLDIMNLNTLDASSPAMRLGPDGNDLAPPPALTDERGHYELTGLFRVRYTVIAEGQRGQLRARQTNVVPDASLDLKTQGLATLSGTVIGPSGPNAVVGLRGPTNADQSVSQGKFSFDHINPGSYTVYVESLAGGGSTQATVEPGGATTISITLAPNGTVTGTLTDPTGKPAGGMEVAVFRDDDHGAEPIRPPTVAGADGSFRIDHAPGLCHLTVLRRPARPFIRHGLVVEPGKTLDLGTVALDAPPTAP